MHAVYNLCCLLKIVNPTQLHQMSKRSLKIKLFEKSKYYLNIFPLVYSCHLQQDASKTQLSAQVSLQSSYNRFVYKVSQKGAISCWLIQKTEEEEKKHKSVCHHHFIRLCVGMFWSKPCFIRYYVLFCFILFFLRCGMCSAWCHYVSIVL